MPNHLRKLRKSAGYKKAKEVSELVGCHYKTIYAIEYGDRIPSPELAAKLRKIYNCSFDDIFLPFYTTDSSNSA